MYDVDGHEPDFVHAPYNLAAMMIYAGMAGMKFGRQIYQFWMYDIFAVMCLCMKGIYFFEVKSKKKSSIEKKSLKNRKNMIFEHFKE